MAFLACLVAANRHLRLGSKVRFLELESEILAKVGTALRAIATAATTGSAENVAEAKKLAEDVAEVLEYGRIESRALRCRAAQPSVAEAVINRTFFGVGEYGVCLADFFEFLFGIRIVRIAVRMILKSKLPISGLELDLSYGARYAQHLVVVAFCICSQTRPQVSKF